ncbi:cytidylate kinase [Thermotomaculum hydrothermale]|uniref:Cytidylate kinase n=1 Tax=Thermotomaculum hydrothermale TaxID=981385 RepID=A0A7R6PV22_9BACT|nr:(d)CMP kinase [Thermotomaculum hydrothermale]BBB33237.1 cytidylate kinase [Thermotomaculum hydrothermale]
MKKNVVAIDGPSGAGKSTIAKIIAKKLGYFYLNTGAMYRAVALYLHRKGEKPSDEITEKDLKGIELDFDDEGNIYLNGENVSDKIITPEISKLASDFSKLKVVRKFLTEQQRKIGLSRPSVLEGRDIGTVVFPDAKYKFFLDASPEERARRRYLQLKEKNPETKITFEEVLKQQLERDKQDSSRDLAPLKKAEDAIYIDTTGMEIEDVVEKILEFIKE